MTVPEPIPFFNLSGELEQLGAELEAAAIRVLRSGQFILGPDVTAFEEECAAYLGVKHAVGVNSGTDALVIAMRALGVEAGDEVIVPPFTFIATAETVAQLGAVPVFADVLPDTYCLDPAAVEKAITPRTKGVIPVHLFGHAADMDALRAVTEPKGLFLLEDAAQVIGGTYKGRMCGGLGDIAAWSFYPTKNLGACGDGGILTTDDDDLADRVRMLRGHGSKGREQHVMVGYNSRLDSLQAAFLRVKLPHLEGFCDGRRRLAARYDEALAGEEHVTPPPVVGDVKHVYHQYTVRIDERLRDAVRGVLTAEKIGSMVYYQTPLHRLPVFEHLGGSFPVAEQLSREVLSLPVWPHLPEADQERVIEVLQRALRG